MRILEQILTNGHPGLKMDVFRSEIQQAEIFNIDNVAEYLYAGTDQEEWDVKKDFPCLAPPFPVFWMEFCRPSRIVSRAAGVQSNAYMPHRCGFLFRFVDQKNAIETLKSKQYLEDAEMAKKKAWEAFQHAWTPEIDRELKAAKAAGADFRNLADPLFNKLSPDARKALSMLYTYGLAEHTINHHDTFVPAAEKYMQNTRWVGYCLSFIQIARNGEIWGPLTTQQLILDAEGNVIDTMTQYDARLTGATFAGLDCLSTIWFAPLLAISFCHCRGVTMTPEKKPDAKIIKRNPKRKRISYKVLEITPLKAVIDRARSEHHTDLKRALHICRGHFADYREHGLFGKYFGRFWIQQHMRGSAAEGVALKDYKVNQPGGA
jgi:hypothetical protein